MASKLRSLPSLVRAVDTSRVRLPPKVKAPIYNTPEFQQWRALVVARAGGRCQAKGCSKAQPEHRMYADHIIELKDGGPPFDINNGQCLCASHHELKTMAARAKRHQSSQNPGG